MPGAGKSPAFGHDVGSVSSRLAPAHAEALERAAFIHHQGSDFHVTLHVPGTVDLKAVGNFHGSHSPASDNQVLGDDGPLHQATGGDGDLSRGMDGAFDDTLYTETMGVCMDLALEKHILAEQGMNGWSGFRLGFAAEDGHGSLLESGCLAKGTQPLALEPEVGLGIYGFSILADLIM